MEHAPMLAAAVYDFRNKFNVSLIDKSIDWFERLLLFNMLKTDRTSKVFAVSNGLSEPFSLESQYLSSILDVTVAVNTEKGKRPKPTYRPTDNKEKRLQKKAQKDNGVTEEKRALAKAILQKAKTGQLLLNEETLKE